MHRAGMIKNISEINTLHQGGLWVVTAINRSERSRIHKAVRKLLFYLLGNEFLYPTQLTHITLLTNNFPWTGCVVKRIYKIFETYPLEKEVHLLFSLRLTALINHYSVVVQLTSSENMFKINNWNLYY